MATQLNRLLAADGDRPRLYPVRSGWAPAQPVLVSVAGHLPARGAASHPGAGQHQAGFRLFMGMLKRLGCWTTGSAAYPLPCRALIVANHPSLLDYVILAAELPVCDCIVKRALWHNVFLGGVVRAADYIQRGSGTAVATVHRTGTPRWLAADLSGRYPHYAGRAHPVAAGRRPACLARPK